MNLDFNLNLSQQQKLIMNQNMQLSIKILQMPCYELREYINYELENNPTLEVKLNNDNLSNEKIHDIINYLDSKREDNYINNKANNEISPMDFIVEKISLKGFLYDQICGKSKNEKIKDIVKYLIENLDNRGYLEESIESIASELGEEIEDVEEALNILQNLEPFGIGARNLKECLLIQIYKKGLYNKYIEDIINEYLDLVANNKLNIIAKKLKIAVDEVQTYTDIIKKLEPKPSRGYYTGEDTKFIVPDAFIRKIDDEYIVIMNDEILPMLKINDKYKKVLTNSDDEKAKQYIKGKISDALFLIKSINSRKNTLNKVLEIIIKRQSNYLELGKRYIKPMTMKDIAVEIGMHESTVSRAIKEKYILTSYGTVKIKDLFTASTSNKNESEEKTSVIEVKSLIEKLILEEDKRKPLSDQSICDEISNKNLNISRRTVAKYREEMGIQSSSKRKRV